MSKPETETKHTTPGTSTGTSTSTSAPKPEPKTDPNPFAAFLDFANLGKIPFGPEAFAPWFREHAARIEAISDEVAVFEKAMVKRIKTNAADVAALVQDTLDYVSQVGAEWRKIAIDTARRAADLTGRA